MHKHPCPDCLGTGRDEERTKEALRTRRIDEGSYVRCWTCVGNGVDPEYLHRSTHKAEDIK